MGTEQLMQVKEAIKMPSGIAAKYEYKGDDGGNHLMPEKSGHYWINGYAMWRPDKCPYGVVGDCFEITGKKVKKEKGIWVWVIEFRKVSDGN